MLSQRARLTWLRIGGLLVAAIAMLAACAAPPDRSSTMNANPHLTDQTPRRPPLDAREHPTLETATFALG